MPEVRARTFVQPVLDAGAVADDDAGPVVEQDAGPIWNGDAGPVCGPYACDAGIDANCAVIAEDYCIDDAGVCDQHDSGTYGNEAAPGCPGTYPPTDSPSGVPDAGLFFACVGPAESACFIVVAAEFAAWDACCQP
jgi:hypothetical protein